MNNEVWPLATTGTERAKPHSNKLVPKEQEGTWDNTRKNHTKAVCPHHKMHPHRMHMRGQRKAQMYPNKHTLCAQAMGKPAHRKEPACTRPHTRENQGLQRAQARESESQKTAAHRHTNGIQVRTIGQSQKAPRHAHACTGKRTTCI